jgi:hypothetical protein
MTTSEDTVDEAYDEFSTETPSSSFEPKEQLGKKMESKRKLEEYLENRRLEKELSYL